MANINISNADLNNANHSSDGNAPVDNPWKESGALVYIALTVLTFSAVVMCFVWSWTKYTNGNSRYSTVVNGDSEEEIELTLNEEDDGVADNNEFIVTEDGFEKGAELDDSEDCLAKGAVLEDSANFTLECSSDENDELDEKKEEDIHELI